MGASLKSSMAIQFKKKPDSVDTAIDICGIVDLFGARDQTPVVVDFHQLFFIAVVVVIIIDMNGDKFHNLSLTCG